MKESSLNHELFLELKNQTVNRSVAAEPHENCYDCQNQSQHFKYFGKWHIVLGLSLGASLYIILAKLPLPLILVTPVFFYPPAIMLLTTFESIMMYFCHMRLEKTLNLRQRIVNTLSSIHKKRRLRMENCLKNGLYTLDKYLEDLSEAKEALRGVVCMADCISSISRLRDIRAEIVALKKMNLDQGRMFRMKLRELCLAIQAPMPQERFETWTANLHQELVILSDVCSRLEIMDLERAAKEGLEFPDPRHVELAYEGFLNALSAPSN